MKSVRTYDGTVLTPFFTKSFVFSNHFSSNFLVDGRVYHCTEQFYMFYKALISGDEEAAQKILDLTQAWEIKRVGSNLRGHNQAVWRKICILVMTIANWAKYTQNVELKRMLFATKGTLLVEATVRDNYWASGADIGSRALLDRANWKGRNVMGRILTAIREKLLIE